MSAFSAATPPCSHSIQCQGEVGQMEDQLRRKLKYFFLNPCEKYHAKKRFPWKLILQLIKIILVTLQLAMFGNFRSSHVDFLEKSRIAFKHLFLKEWNPSYETLPYPPATGVYAIYTIPEFYKHINFAMEQFNKTEDLAIGTFQFARENDTHMPAQFCNTHYKAGQIFAFNQSYVFDSSQVVDCFPVYAIDVYNQTAGKYQLQYNIEEFLMRHNKTIHFNSLIQISLRFLLKSVHLKYLSQLNKPDCYLFNISIVFQNAEHNGQMEIKLHADDQILKCNGRVLYDDGDDEVLTSCIIIFDVIVMLISLASSFLCLRSMIKALALLKESFAFFKEHKDRKLGFYDCMEFVNMWYILIIINDLLTLAGSILKIQLESKMSYDYETCGVLLGTGNLFVWIGVLRYLGFFEKYNILILTMKKAAPSVLRFLVCAGLFYVGFAICGWIVLGPYHVKFRQLSTASECLFALVNGDDMFVTFSALDTPMNSYLWWYSRVYLYGFISLFIYVVLSIFISVIMDTYETIKHYYEHGFPKSYLQRFIEECTDEAHCLFQSDAHQTDSLCCCICVGGSCPRRNRYGTEDDSEDILNERSPLVT